MLGFIGVCIVVTSMFILFVDFALNCIGIIAAKIIAAKMSHPVCYLSMFFGIWVLLNGILNLIIAFSKCPIARNDVVTSEDMSMYSGINWHSGWCTAQEET